MILIYHACAFGSVCAGLQDAFPGHNESPHGNLRADGIPALSLDGQQVRQEKRPTGSEGAHEAPRPSP